MVFAILLLINLSSRREKRNTIKNNKNNKNNYEVEYISNYSKGNKET